MEGGDNNICLVPSVADGLDVPVIAAGGIGDARAIVAACLGCRRRSEWQPVRGHQNLPEAFKDEVVAAGEGDAVGPKGVDAGPVWTMRLPGKWWKRKAPVNLRGIESFAGPGKKGMFEGDLDNGGRNRPSEQPHSSGQTGGRSCDRIG